MASKNHPNYVNGDQVESWNKMDALYDGIGPFNVSKYNTINWNHTLIDTTNLHNERNALWKSQRFEQMCINQRQERNELLRKNKSELMAHRHRIKYIYQIIMINVSEIMFKTF